MRGYRAFVSKLFHSHQLEAETMGRAMMMAVLIAAVALGDGAAPVPADQSAAIQIQPGELKWVDNPTTPSGMKIAILKGALRQPGPFIIRAKFPPNYKLLPHTHPDERDVTVLSGTYYSGTGPTFDESKMTPFPAGGFYTNPAGVPHYSKTGNEEVIIQEAGMGPAVIEYVNPADDPRKR